MKNRSGYSAQYFHFAGGDLYFFALLYHFLLLFNCNTNIVYNVLKEISSPYIAIAGCQMGFYPT